MRVAKALTDAVTALGVVALAGSVAWAQTSVAASQAQPAPVSSIEWRFGVFLDVGYLNSFNSPSNHLFRSRGTTPRVDEANVNMGAGYLRKEASESSRWGLEVSAHAGEDAKLFGFSATAPNIGGANWLRHLGPTNVSYLAPIGDGLTLQGGIFSSFIGYDSLYAKDNFTYTRPWTADFTPFLMLGVNAAYPLGDKLTTTALLLNGYWHLAHANDVPTVGGQVVYKATDHVTVKETVLYGPHQSNTSLTHWRFLSDSIVERRTDRLIMAFEFQVSTEDVDTAGSPRALWVAAQAPVRWAVGGPWTVAVRPEFAWDRDGRWTTFEQFVRAVTSTLEYRVAFQRSRAILRLEHRYDRSTGSRGGFFADTQSDADGLTPGQHLLVFGWIFAFDARMAERVSR